MKAWKVFFLIAGLFNLVAGAAGFFTFESHLAKAGLPAPHYTHPFQLLFLLVMILGVGYLMVWKDPIRNRNIVWLGWLTKVCGFVISLQALRLGELPAENAWQPWIADFPFILIFGLFLFQTRHHPTQPNSTPEKH